MILPPWIAFRIVDLFKPVAFAAAARVYDIAAHPYSEKVDSAPESLQNGLRADVTVLSECGDGFSLPAGVAGYR